MGYNVSLVDGHLEKPNINDGRIKTIKDIAVDFAKDFMGDQECIKKYQDLNFTPCEWFLLVELAQIYYNLMQGAIDREKAKQQQMQAIEFVRNHADIFEELED